MDTAGTCFWNTCGKYLQERGPKVKWEDCVGLIPVDTVEIHFFCTHYCYFGLTSDYCHLENMDYSYIHLERTEKQLSDGHTKDTYMCFLSLP